MDPIGFLVQQHRQINDLFDRFEELALDNLDELTQIAHRLAQHLVVHTEIEEQLLYPAVRDAAREWENRELVLEAFEEHRIAKVLIADILSGSAQDESFIAKVMVLRDIIDPHIIEEEEDLFSLARERLSPEALAALGNQVNTLFGRIEHAPPRLRVSLMEEPAQVRPEGD